MKVANFLRGFPKDRGLVPLHYLEKPHSAGVLILRPFNEGASGCVPRSEYGGEGEARGSLWLSRSLNHSCV